MVLLGFREARSLRKFGNAPHPDCPSTSASGLVFFILFAENYCIVYWIVYWIVYLIVYWIVYWIAYWIVYWIVCWVVIGLFIGLLRLGA